ncbi:hypothetical protein CYMTET_12825 [Cymbomonas tetramitiformis]|uniref:Uncharacterized protein n=1 Tax=Cymbomonas tetramitiformis TaxID=36881 RepID=A0AAE0LBG3_9CHLO|nr:hypothetical protein CYMTET_12825 [Cymbomonas tetramitiformis]|eukprot:gene10634-12577_t
MSSEKPVSPLSAKELSEQQSEASTEPDMSSDIMGEKESMISTIMQEVYGVWSVENVASHQFPKPLPKREAGEGILEQRRYLWTDAFGVLNYVTLARLACDAPARRAAYLASAHALIVSVHTTLGNERVETTGWFPMTKADHGDALKPMFQYKGLRIGKLHAREMSDTGMKYDGMYWHYLDTWLFALARYATESKDDTVLQQANMLIHDVHPAFFRPRAGMLWKVNVDLSPIAGGEYAVNMDDTLGAWLVYNIVAIAAGHRPGIVQVSKEIDETGRVLDDNFMTLRTREPTWDPLSFGMQAWKLQWLGPWADAMRDTFYSGSNITNSLSALDVSKGMQLPFRLYCGLLGAKLSGNDILTHHAEKVLDEITPKAMSELVGASEHSAINKVTFAAALEPLAFARQASTEDLLKLPTQYLTA